MTATSLTTPAYSLAMNTVTASVNSRPPTFILSWRRVLLTVCVSLVLGGLGSLGNSTATTIVLGRYLLVGVSALLAFGIFERWPARTRLPRWALQLIGVFVAVPISAWFAYWLTTGGNPDFAHDQPRLVGFGTLCFLGTLFGPWIALGALVRQKDALARHQALAFELERSELERQALDARLRLLQAQVAPHFLFNTLANVQALVDAGSPQASRRAAQPDRLSARRGAAPARAGDDARPGAASWCAPTWS